MTLRIYGRENWVDASNIPEENDGASAKERRVVSEHRQKRERKEHRAGAGGGELADVRFGKSPYG